MDFELKLFAGKVTIVLSLLIGFSICSICCCGCIISTFTGKNITDFAKPNNVNKKQYKFTISKYAIVTDAELNEFEHVTNKPIPITTTTKSTGCCCNRKQLQSTAKAPVIPPPVTNKSPNKVFVYEFSADNDSKAIPKLLQFVNYIESVAKENDIIILQITSSGGSAQDYERAYSQLYSLRGKGIQLIATIDVIAASGGYMLASACNQIYAASTASVGSIGVTATLSTFGETLRTLGVKSVVFETSSNKHPYDPRIDMTSEQQEIIRKDLEDTFHNFKQIVLKRGKISSDPEDPNYKEVFSAKTFYASEACRIGLIDNISLARNVIHNYNETHNIYDIRTIDERDFTSRLSEQFNLSNIFHTKLIKHV